MRLSNGFVIDKEKTFGELKFTAVRDVFLQNEDGTPSTQLKKRIYDLKCSLHGGIIPVSVSPEIPLRELDTFICVVEAGSFSKAAEELYISENLLMRCLPICRCRRCLEAQKYRRNKRGEQ